MNSSSLGRRYPRQLSAVIILAVGLATIGGTWAFQLIGGYVPCALCLQERIPYYVGLPLALVALILGALPWPSRVFLFLTAITFGIGTGLGIYHAGAEWHWWAGPAACGATGAATGSAGNLLDSLKHIRVVSCTEASWRFPGMAWGLSFAGWNAVISAFLALVGLWGALAQKRSA